jgi:hypothetical protein
MGDFREAYVRSVVQQLWGLGDIIPATVHHFGQFLHSGSAEAHEIRGQTK